MKKKELERLAKEIIAQEEIIKNSSNPIEVNAAKDKIVDISGGIESLEDMLLLDEIIQKYFKKF